MIFLEPSIGVIPKKHPVTAAVPLYRANDARTHAYDLLGFSHKESAQR